MAVLSEVSIDHAASPDRRWWLPRADLGRLVATLRAEGREVVGPVVEDGTIVYREITDAAALPSGVTDEQSPGRYRTLPSSDAPHTFGYASSPTSWKRWTFPPSVGLGTARRDGDTLSFEPPVRETRPLAFLGARACDLAAIAIHDRVLRDGFVADDDYVARRADILTIGVDCAAPSSTCFCSSMGTGPEVTRGHDLALTELDEGFVVRVGSDAGRALVERLALDPADPTALAAARQVPERARAAMTRTLATDGMPARLMARPDHPRWAEVGSPGTELEFAL